MFHDTACGRTSILWSLGRLELVYESLSNVWKPAEPTQQSRTCEDRRPPDRPHPDPITPLTGTHERSLPDTPV
jgi:hypothetical protein